MKTNYSQLNYTEIQSNPILDIGARLWEKDRSEAFKTCYKAMRFVDNLVDNRKSTGEKISEEEKAHYISLINNWESNTALMQGPFQKELLDTVKKFDIPQWPWKKFANSMIYDLNHDGFDTFQDFLDYSEGAAVAPAAIGVHICSAKKENGKYIEPKFDVVEFTRPMAYFAYIVHIIRDFEKEVKSNLNYFSDDLMKENNLDFEKFREIASGGKIPAGFRALMKKYYELAEKYQKEARKTFDKTLPLLDSQYRMSIEVIYSLYSQVFEKIDVANGTFSAAELNPTPEEIKERIDLTISKV
ncbi:MAG: squalene/phytoene synthase family protein [Candidatus Diapherotrites archaeon]